ncbi:MAG: tRNA ((37)-N6)-dimethylallyltransferase MiaA [Actinomycetota bacterium]
MTNLIALVGATASGKSSLAIEIATALTDAEIINADAMQLYRGMDIGTAKLSSKEQWGIRHHLLSVIDPSEELTAVEYRELFDTAVRDVLSRGKTPIVVGGSTLYLASALDELSFAPTDSELRSELEKQSEEIGALSMHAKLRELDPAAAEKIPATNRRRVIRAIEVIKLSGKNYSASLPDPSYRRPTVQLAIDVSREELGRRIEQRVEKMWREGLVDEVRELIKKELSRTARVAIGYKQAIDFIEGRLTAEQAKEEIVFLTNRYAKKQGTWFRRDKRIHWLRDEADLSARALEIVRLER